MAVMALLASLSACGPALTAKPKPAPGDPARPFAPPPPPLADDAIMCPADAQLCADGSYVSRNPAKGCAFNPCPGDIPH